MRIEISPKAWNIVNVTFPEGDSRRGFRLCFLDTSGGEEPGGTLMMNIETLSPDSTSVRYVAYHGEPGAYLVPSRKPNCYIPKTEWRPLPPSIRFEFWDGEGYRGRNKVAMPETEGVLRDMTRY